MIVRSLEFSHFKLPFKSGFTHARKTRAVGDTLLIRLETTEGVVGYGEVLPRSYVTGETVDSIWGDSTQQSPAERVARCVLGQQFSNQGDLTQWIDGQLVEFQTQTALFGGIELALWNAFCQVHGIDFDRLLGPVFKRTTGKCVTVGFDATTQNLRRYAIDARLKGATVIKLKLGLPDDIERLQQLDKHLNKNFPIRVDANGLYDADRAEALLKACARTTTLESFEEPFDSNMDGISDLQNALYSRFGVSFVADESVCSLEDAQKWQKTGCFQLYNLRVGKHGGLYASRKIRDFAAHYGIGLVSGSMVGETGILTQASELLLSRSTQFNYVEGLGQNTRFLVTDPVSKLDFAGEMKPFRLKSDECAHLIHRSICFD